MHHFKQRSPTRSQNLIEVEVMYSSHFSHKFTDLHSPFYYNSDAFTVQHVGSHWWSCPVISAHEMVTGLAIKVTQRQCGQLVLQYDWQGYERAHVGREEGNLAKVKSV